ncbi:hypothetical protein ACIRU3_26130 [Streptomyces sp. NPDC101151]|uniref:hypothetical protein n=1 Tax=Streptomyces sp. NPDC101151 TaxID=3366115 RepID=UPI00380608E2
MAKPDCPYPDHRSPAGIRTGKSGSWMRRKSITLLVYTMMVMATLEVLAPPATAAPTCRIGAYITDIYGLDVSPRTINADFWLWSVCPSADLDATRRLEFINATQVSQSDRSVERVGSQYWSQVKVSGTFRQKFDLSEYPFDRQDVQIQVEDSELNASQFTYVADTANSGYDHGISLGGFKIRDFGVQVVTHTYQTSFGDPRITHGQNSQYSQFVIDFKLDRDDVAGFIREAWPAYVAFLISFISYWIWSKELLSVMGARYGVLGASLFSVVVSMRSSALSGILFGVTLIDQIHLATLLYTLVAVGCTTYIVWSWADPKKSPSVRRTNRFVALSTTIVYLIANAVTIGFAIR